MRFLFILSVAFVAPVFAQNADIQKQLIQRDQQTEAFALQLRQSVEAARVPAASRPAFESKQLWDQQRLENLGNQQLLEVRPETPDALRLYERQRFEAERIPFRSPIVEVPVRHAPPPARLQPSLKGNVDVIGEPR